LEEENLNFKKSFSFYLPSAPVTVEYGVNEGVAIGPVNFKVCEFVLLRMDF
jgi:hypothetical protein